MSKDDRITVIAVLKSVIESGADEKDWLRLTKAGLRVYGTIAVNKQENS